MAKARHEFRDPVHNFIRVDDKDRTVIDSMPLQRLRNIHQLATSYLVYPAATHRRFEHSLGVMELAGAVFDVVTDPDNLSENLRRKLRGILDEREHWRRVLRTAALCHDIGHLPFSHAPEDLLPAGWDHERMTAALIQSPALSGIWRNQRPTLDEIDIARLAISPKAFAAHFPDAEKSDVWKDLLSEIISGEAFGVDRMDYLLRDSLHLGVAYGRFDHYRLIDSLRILPSPSAGMNEDDREPQLGVTEGGLHSAEALLLARYFMFTQVYFHPVRRIYDLHLGEFLKEWLPGGTFTTDPSLHLEMTDAEVLVGLRKAAQDLDALGHEPARRIIHREHFRVLWERNQPDVEKNSDAGRVIFDAACEEFGKDKIRRPPPINPKAPTIDFPVQLRGERISSAQSESDVLQKLPPIASDVVYVEPNLRDTAGRWLQGNLEEILKRVPREED
jgi:uncharacterized protein